IRDRNVTGVQTCALPIFNRHAHAQSGALLAYDLLRSRGMEATEATLVANGIANHDEQHGFPSTAIAAALILADKSDVHKNRVRKIGRASCRERVRDSGGQ